MLCSTSLTVKTSFLQLVIQDSQMCVPVQAHTVKNKPEETDLGSIWTCTPVIS